jgi:hypothetical protein
MEYYRSIYLINIGTFFLNKNSQQHIKKFIRHEQAGFIPVMEGWFNKCKSINVIEHINRIRGKKIKELY